MLCVTEFDSPGALEMGAHFHIVFSAPLDEHQQGNLRNLWLKTIGASNNQGGLFNYGAKGGGRELANYVAKDLKRRDFVKYPAPWLPKRTECRLWFCVGLRRRPAYAGAAMMANMGKRRRRFCDRTWAQGEVAGRALPSMEGQANLSL